MNYKLLWGSKNDIQRLSGYGEWNAVPWKMHDGTANAGFWTLTADAIPEGWVTCERADWTADGEPVKCYMGSEFHLGIWSRLNATSGGPSTVTKKPARLMVFPGAKRDVNTTLAERRPLTITPAWAIDGFWQDLEDCLTVLIDNQQKIERDYGQISGAISAKRNKYIAKLMESDTAASPRKVAAKADRKFAADVQAAELERVAEHGRARSAYSRACITTADKYDQRVPNAYLLPGLPAMLPSAGVARQQREMAR